MTEPTNNSAYQKSRALVLLEYLLLLTCLCVIAVRTTFTEGLSAQSSNQPMGFTDTLYSLTVSTVLIFSFIIWFVANFCSSRFHYRASKMEIGIALFAAAALLAALAAANKRAAVTDIACFLAPILMAVMLVQILDSKPKIKLLLVCIAALGVVAAYQCAEQFFESNQMMIEKYEQDPQSILDPLGIVPGSFQHMLLEHRLYSRGVRGYFTTANSAGSFALLASFAALALFLQQFKNRKSPASSPRRLIACGFAVAVVLFGLFITRSKGAIAAALIAVAFFLTYLSFPDWLRAHKKTLLILCLLLVLAGASAVVFYGITYDRLPGGNSMLVRWQYWRASAKMYADHYLTGVGPANFPYFYPCYKDPAALETVADPHNFPLSIITQYGPLGLAAFLAILFVPLTRIIFPPPLSLLKQTQRAEPNFKTLAIVFLALILAALLFIRPLILPMPPCFWLEMIINIVYMYLMPLIAFALGFWLFAADHKTTPYDNSKVTIAALFCACLGLALHNLVDYAIFEPAIFTTFFALFAALIALHYRQNPSPASTFTPPACAKIIVAAAALAVVVAYLNYAIVPIAKSSRKIKQAYLAASNGDLDSAHDLLNNAADLDPLSPAAHSLNGRLYLKIFLTFDQENTDALLNAQNAFLSAIRRNDADYRNFERLTEVYALLAENDSAANKTAWLTRALDNASAAVLRYPGYAKLRIKLAQIADQLEKNNIALQNYKKAIDIENSYRRQFQQMYPGRPVFSRLGEYKYNLAKQRVKQLSLKTSPPKTP